MENNENKVFENLVAYISSKTNSHSVKPIYKTDDFALYHADCIEIMKHFPDNYVDMIFADSPYLLSNNGITCYAGKMVSVNKGNWDKSNGFENDLSLSCRYEIIQK